MQENPGAQVLTTVLRDPGRPRITWYGADGERVELSGAVLANWVAKTANLLVDELDVGLGTRVALRLPMHWKAATWALATWQVGACLVLGDETADLSVTSQPLGLGTEVAVALPALARRFDGPLPAGVLDGTAVLAGHPDRFDPGETPHPKDRALVAPGLEVTYADLAASVSAARPARRLRIARAELTADALVDLLATLGSGGSVVLVAHGRRANQQDGAGAAELVRLAGVELAVLDEGA